MRNKYGSGALIRVRFTTSWKRPRKTHPTGGNSGKLRGTGLGMPIWLQYEIIDGAAVNLFKPEVVTGSCFNFTEADIADPMKRYLP